ncbi:hypothetical protein V3C99_012842 [Haemonchus contortus]|uniref:Uncharacterized protein n=1 Tax=Haemonchus contortus TaxID=6289 RepID=A0A7I5EF33_HAECO|nr:Protein of unknown function DUF780 domain containing protein [Haemonchus contortus]
MGDKSCYMGAGGYQGYMGSGTGQGYAREEYAGSMGGGGGGGQDQNKPYQYQYQYQPQQQQPPQQPYGSSGYAGNVGGSDAQASCYFGPK